MVGRSRTVVGAAKTTPAALLVLLVVLNVHYQHRLFCCYCSASKPTFLVSTGLRNLGNTCYLNSQLQCAYHIPRVRDLVLHGPPEIVVDENDGGSATAATASEAEQENLAETHAGENGEPVDESAKHHQQEHREDSLALQALRLLFQDMNEAAQDEAAAGVTAVAEPKVLCRTLGIPVMEQQDSQEFWKLLIPALQLPCLTDLYQGAFEDYIVALDGSGRERRREECFLDLSLDVSSGSVSQALEKTFGEPELLSEADGGNGWRPEKGADKVDAHKGCVLIRHGLPSILQLHLKRFQYDWSTDTTSKINDPFAFPLQLDLSSICKKDDEEEDGDGGASSSTLIYDLQAVVIHAGVYGAGHYYAYVRPDVRKDTWYRFNDHIVNSVSFDEVFNDARGGRAPTTVSLSDDGEVEPRKKKNPFQRIFSAFTGGGSSYGYGGRTSNAYVLQYVKRSDIPMLYDDDT